MERNVTFFDMTESLGQFVLSGKANMSRDCELQAADNCPMARELAKSEYNQGFVQRVRSAREARGLTQDGVAQLLDMEQDTYKQYESPTRFTLLPHDLIERFCLACGITEKWLITGKGPGPKLLEMPAPRKRAGAKKARAA
jgi:DNA-binding XRE family transcriptional regulator